jgi:hypothetical protein
MRNAAVLECQGISGTGHYSPRPQPRFKPLADPPEDTSDLPISEGWFSPTEPRDHQRHEPVRSTARVVPSRG